MNTHPTASVDRPRRIAAAVAAALLLNLLPSVRAATPQVGEAAPNFSLRTLDDKVVELKALTAKRPVVLVVLRGWYGAQCPLCSRQVNDFMTKAADFAARGVQVVMVYPGPSDQLKAHAQEFLGNKDWPADFLYVLDPDYTFTHAYGLRWDAPRETAYPSTFIIDRAGRVRFAHVSKTHGNRVSAAAALAAVDELKQK
jgi:thioredoxin-dependent peroxiredoxin